MKSFSKLILLVVIFCFFSIAAFSQEVTVSVKDTASSKKNSGTVSSNSELCFNPEKKKPNLKPIKYESKINGKKIIISDCCPIQVFPIKTPEIIYPSAAKAVNAQGNVAVKVFVNEKGKVFWAEVDSGHPLLRAVALRVACQTVFKPYVCHCGKKRTGQFQTIINFNFVVE